MVAPLEDHAFDAYSSSRLDSLKGVIFKESPEYILNVNESDYIEHLISQFSIDPLVLHFDRVEASNQEEMIAGEDFPPGFNVYEGKSYLKPVIKYHLPVSGDLELLNCVPNPHIQRTFSVSLENEAICFDIVDFYGDANRIKQEADSILNTIREQSGHLASNVQTIQQLFARRLGASV
jgi:hypothetical protein